MNTNVPEEYYGNCMKKIGEIWKKWKATVKRQYYKPNKDDSTVLQIPSERVRPEDWKILVQRWQTKESIDEAERNKRNRQQYEFPYGTGKVSFANIRLKMKNDKEDLSRKNVFLKTRRMKNGPSQEVKDIVDQMDRSLSHIPLDEQTEADKEKAFIDVMGRDKHGRVRTYGCGPTPTRLLQSSLSTSTATTSSNRIKEIVESELATRMAEYEAQRAKEIEDAIAVRIAEYGARQAKENEATIAAQMKQILESIGLIVPAEILVRNSPGVRSSVGQVATTSTHGDEENHGDNEEENLGDDEKERV